MTLINLPPRYKPGTRLVSPNGVEYRVDKIDGEIL